MNEKYKLFCDGIEENYFEKVAKNFDLSFVNKIIEENNSYPLCKAANLGCYEIVKLFLDKGANIEIADDNKMRPLHWASGNGKLDVVKLLVERGAQREIEACRGYRPIHYAVGGNHVDVFRFFLYIRVDINAKTKEPDGVRRTIFDIMDKCNYFESQGMYKKWIEYDSKVFEIVRNNDLRNLKPVFLKEKISVLDKNSGESALDIASKHEDHKCLEYMFNEDLDEELVVKAMAYTIRKKGITVEYFRLQFRLYRSILFNDQESFVKSSIETMNSVWVGTNETFLKICVKNNRVVFVEHLLPYLIEVTDDWKKCIIELKNEQNVFLAQIIENRMSFVKSYQNNHNRLHLAVQDNNIIMLRYLLNNNLFNKEENYLLIPTPLSLAISLGYFEIVQEFVKRNMFINVIDVDGRNPLLQALITHNFHAAEILFDHTNDILLSDYIGFDSKLLAILHNQPKIVEKLMKKNINVFNNVLNEKHGRLIKTLFNNNCKLPIETNGEITECLISLYMKLHKHIPEFIVDNWEMLCNNHNFQYNNDQYNLLHLSCKLLMKNVASLLINKNNYQVDKPDNNFHNNTPLITLITQSIGEPNQKDNAYFDIMELLVKNGADIGYENLLKERPIDLVFDSKKCLNILLPEPGTKQLNVPVSVDKLMSLFESKWHDILQKLIPIQPVDSIRQLLVSCFEWSDKSEEIIDLTREYYCVLPNNNWNQFIEDMLLKAAQNNDMKTFKHCLVEYKENENDFNNILCKLIGIGSEELCLEMVKHAISNDMIDTLLTRVDSETGDNPLHAAARKGYMKLFKKLVMNIDNICHFNQESTIDKNTPLEIILRSHQQQIQPNKLENLLELLIKCGYDIYSTGSSRQRPVMINLINDAKLKKKIADFHKRNFTKKQDNSKDEIMCPICDENKLDYIITNCGHTLCKECIDKVVDCPFCRVSIKGRQKIYIMNDRD